MEPPKSAESIFFEKIFLPLLDQSQIHPQINKKYIEETLNQVKGVLLLEGNLNEEEWKKTASELLDQFPQNRFELNKLTRELYHMITPFRAKELIWNINKSRSDSDFLKDKNIIMLFGTTGNK